MPPAIAEYLPILSVVFSSLSLAVSIVGFVQSRPSKGAPPAHKPEGRYDLLMRIADDAVLHAEQRKKAITAQLKTVKWDPGSMRDAALHYAENQAKAAGASFDRDSIARAVEASLGKRNAEKA